MNSHLVGMISSTDGSVQTLGRTELDLYNNMLVFGSQCYFISHSSREATVNAFSDLVGSINSELIVDVAVMYDCLNTQRTYIIIAINVLHVPSMKHNLIPPFVMREAGLVVNDTEMIHVKDTSHEYYSIYDDKTGLRILLQLSGVFLYFQTRKPSIEDLTNDTTQAVMLTPEGPS